MVDFAALQNREQTLAVVGLGYVGLPLAVAFSRHMNVIGFDINAGRIEELRKGHDRTNEVTDEALAAATIEYTCDPADLARAAVIIVAVPTPIDEHRSPDLTPATPWAATCPGAAWWSMNPRSTPASPKRSACPS